MGLTPDQIRQWLEEGIEAGASHVIVVCDTWDYDHYPVLVYDNIDEILEKYTTKKDVIGAPISDNMEKPMEVYDLDMDLDEQLKPGTRVWNL